MSDGSLICKMCGKRFPADAKGKLFKNGQTGHLTDWQCATCCAWEMVEDAEPQNIKTALRRP